MRCQRVSPPSRTPQPLGRRPAARHRQHQLPASGHPRVPPPAAPPSPPKPPEQPPSPRAVSYTHLTLPTICSV
eukprot:7141537-Prorocentrum_lima.AAC.1